MADVIGPNSYLPGQKIKVPAGAMCDEHPDRPAVCRIVGETDSFGSELIDACQECMDKIDNCKKDASRTCDWCGALGELMPTRDPDEGMSGRVYYVCHACRVKQSEYRADEINDRYRGSNLDDPPYTDSDSDIEEYFGDDND